MDAAVVDTTLLTFADGSPGIVEDGAVGIDENELAYAGPSAGFDPAPQLQPGGVYPDPVQQLVLGTDGVLAHPCGRVSHDSS